MTTWQDDIQQIASLPLPWEHLENCNILVTGATGLIGSTLVEALLARKQHYNIYATGRNEERAQRQLSHIWNDPRLHFLQYDVTSPLLADVDFHYIIHAASDASPAAFANTPVEVMKANFMGVCNLLDYGRHHGLRRMLYVSSGEVYGEGDGRVFTEDYSGYVNPTKARSCYPQSKRASETLCASYAAEYGIETVIARPCHTYGPGFTPADNRVYAQFIRNVLQGNDIVMKSDGSQFRSWCYVADCASALLYILLKGMSGEAYNIADEQSNISIRQLAEMVAEIAHRKVVIELPSNVEAAGFNVVTKSVYDTTKLQALGWIIKGSMQEKMQRTINSVQAR